MTDVDLVMVGSMRRRELLPSIAISFEKVSGISPSRRYSHAGQEFRSRQCGVSRPNALLMRASTRRCMSR